ncbi:MAG: Tol-Pal system subunit TolQ, partial [Algicola sp.]|nr:Tol-Pal system subunit TolQ [Algicola sp.]
MSSELSFIDLFIEASLLVQLVMLTLLAMSVASWAMIFQRIKVLGSAETQAKKFEDRFWSGVDLAKLYNEVAARTSPQTGLESLFKSGFKEFSRLRNHPAGDTEIILDSTHRSMRVALSREIETL